MRESRVVWKYSFDRPESVVTFAMPIGAEFLTLQTQFNVPCVWMLVNPKAELENRTFVVFGTGHSMEWSGPRDLSYVGTFQLDGGAFVFHVFERMGG